MQKISQEPDPDVNYEKRERRENRKFTWMDRIGRMKEEFSRKVAKAAKFRNYHGDTD